MSVDNFGGPDALLEKFRCIRWMHNLGVLGDECDVEHWNERLLQERKAYYNGLCQHQAFIEAFTGGSFSCNSPVIDTYSARQHSTSLPVNLSQALTGQSPSGTPRSVPATATAAHVAQDEDDALVSRPFRMIVTENHFVSDRETPTPRSRGGTLPREYPDTSVTGSTTEEFVLLEAWSESMRKILGLWCAKNPDIGYHDAFRSLLSVIMQVLESDYSAAHTGSKAAASLAADRGTMKSDDDELLERDDGVHSRSHSSATEGDREKEDGREEEPDLIAIATEEFQRLSTILQAPLSPSPSIAASAVSNSSLTRASISSPSPRSSMVPTASAIAEAPVAGGTGLSGAERENEGIMKFIEPDSYVVFAALMGYLRQLFDKKDDEDSFAAKLFHHIQENLLPSVAPFAHDQIQKCEIDPSSYLSAWLHTMFAGQFNVEDVVMIWDACFRQLPSQESDTVPELLPYLAVSYLITLRDEVISAESETALFNVLTQDRTKITPKTSLIIAQALYIQDPYLLSSVSGVNVVKFVDLSPGLIVNGATGSWFVTEFTRGGPAENSGQIRRGDMIYAINGVLLLPRTEVELKKYIRTIPKPYYIAFRSGIDPRFMHEAALLSPLTQSLELLKGESILGSIEATRESFVPDLPNQVLTEVLTEGYLRISEYRLLFTTGNAIVWALPLTHVQKLTTATASSGLLKDAASIFPQDNGADPKADDLRFIIYSKTLQIQRFVMPNPYLLQKFLTILSARAFSLDRQAIFAFIHYGHSSNRTAGGWGRAVHGQRGVQWSPYDPVADYERLGLCSKDWRFVNQRYIICKSYPAFVVVPSLIKDGELRAVREFRSKSRIPATVWKHPETQATITRSSQPLTGMRSNRCKEDEKILQMIAAISDPVNKKYFIIDARSRTAGMGNRALGKGSERMEFYPGAEKIYMNIGNIHALRESMRQLALICDPKYDGGDFYSKLESCGWLKHVQKILSASVHVAKIVDTDGVSCLVHCSDGWDRTTQIVATAEVLMDPFYRTFKGFQILIEKEWCGFGHMFSKRCGHWRESNDQQSPVFVLWMDNLWQIMRQYPTAFEFTDNLLIALIDYAYGCRFGNFLFDSNFERMELEVPKRTLSVWTHIDEHRPLFINELYIPQKESIFPSASHKNVRLWEQFFLRWDSSILPSSQMRSTYH